MPPFDLLRMLLVSVVRSLISTLGSILRMPVASGMVDSVNCFTAASMMLWGNLTGWTSVVSFIECVSPSVVDIGVVCRVCMFWCSLGMGYD